MCFGITSFSPFDVCIALLGSPFLPHAESQVLATCLPILDLAVEKRKESSNVG